MIGVIAKKIGMTSVYQENTLIPCTVIEAKPSVITQIKSEAKDGYEAIQLAYDEKKVKNTTKPLQGHFKVAKVTPKKKIVEIRDFDRAAVKKNIALGTKLHIEDIFKEREFIDVVGVSKGKGFCGVVKRHGFSGVGERTHGQHNRQRSPGSIGAASFPSRVFPGMRMAGRTGGKRVTTKNLQIIKIIPEKSIIVLKGSVPGTKQSYLLLQK